METLDHDFKHISETDQKAIEILKLDSMNSVKQIRGARIGLMILIGLNIIGAFVGYSQGNDIVDIIVESFLVSGTYLFSILVMFKKPKVALITATSVYVLYNILMFMAVPEMAFKGLIFKGFVVFAFIKAIMAAFEFEKIRQELKGYGVELTFEKIELNS